MKRANWMRIIPAAVFLLLQLPAMKVSADCGSVPFDMVLRDALFVEKGAQSVGGVQVSFDPLKVSVFEPRQRALILWNGAEEILLLSTDQRASRASAVLEVIPLPARPAVSLGEFETFEKAQKLVVEKRMWAMAHGGARAGAAAIPASAGRIDFAQKLGAHDLTVAEALDGAGFVAFVQGYLQEKYQTPAAPIRPEFVKIIESYLDEGFRWFAFDVINLTEKNQSRQPIEYRFRSDSVFYPLRISTLERGDTEVDLLVFTKHGATRFEGLPARAMNPEKPVALNAAEVEGLNAGWAGFFPAGASVTMDQFAIRGPSESLVRDVKIK